MRQELSQSIQMLWTGDLQCTLESCNHFLTHDINTGLETHACIMLSDLEMLTSSASWSVIRWSRFRPKKRPTLPTGTRYLWTDPIWQPCFPFVSINQHFIVQSELYLIITLVLKLQKLGLLIWPTIYSCMYPHCEIISFFFLSFSIIYIYICIYLRQVSHQSLILLQYIRLYELAGTSEIYMRQS